MQEIIVDIWLIICGCICIWKGFYSFSKTEKLKAFLEDKDYACQAEGMIRVVRVEYHARHRFDDYIVNITFTDFREKNISVTKTVNSSHCSTKYLRKNKKKTEVPATIFYRRENPKECIIEELKEFEYIRNEGWIMLLAGVLFILLGGVLIYYYYWRKVG
ncbi:hypothetical protein EII17_06890 [Clostridiales bacterium COT073_COT-073]|nr:hypothetical protein EII17_06890 [Clostridiales bacterium COT073_COT-073]